VRTQDFPVPPNFEDWTDSKRDAVDRYLGFLHSNGYLVVPKADAPRENDPADKAALDELTREIIEAMDFLDGPGGQWLFPGVPTREQYARHAAAHVFWRLHYRPTAATI